MGDEEIRGTFGDGVAAPLFEFEASRLKGGRAFTPNVIRIWLDRVEEYQHHVVLKKGTQTIHFGQVAQVKLARGLVWSDVTVESTGGHTIKILGLHKLQGDRVKSLLDDAIAHYRAPHVAAPPPAPPAPAASGVADVMSEIERLHQLQQSGALTDDELTQAKTALLNRI